MTMQSGIAFLGEPLLELAAAGSDRYSLGVAGDVFNTAVAVAQLGTPAFLATSVGTAAQDQRFFECAETYGVSPDLIERDSEHQAGLYLISNAPDGERSFSYWRNDSAAKHLFSTRSNLDAMLDKLQSIENIYLSGITLSLMSTDARELFYDWVSGYRQSGGKVIYDNNYRARLWASSDGYRTVNREMLVHTDVFLPSLEDVISSGEVSSEEDARKWILDSGVAEIVIKNGTSPITVWNGKQQQEITVVAQAGVVDTTGAGDGFNGGYLAARFSGFELPEAVKVGMQVSAEVVCHQGAILPLAEWSRLKAQLL
ncbi:sugar kinase [Pseudomaricurvus sp.]|uniref:sugar kinase n=1 Tax=Pseudomaricurvus sp. TaxID=2004510 RepID=UPI003F6C74AD